MNWRYGSDFAADPERAHWVARFPSRGTPHAAAPSAPAAGEASIVEQVAGCADPLAARFRSQRRDGQRI